MWVGRLIGLETYDLNNIAFAVGVLYGFRPEPSVVLVVARSWAQFILLFQMNMLLSVCLSSQECDGLGFRLASSLTKELHETC
jgi:hypothetical protein